MTINEFDIKICASGLQLVGADEITSFDDETRESRICATNYAMIKRNCLQKHPWRFSIRQQQLSKLVEKPIFDFNNAYQLPTDFLRFIGKQNPDIEHQVFENKIYTNADPLFIAMQYDVAAQYFPAYFQYYLVLELSGFFATSLLEDEGKQQTMAALAKNQLIFAKSIDSQNGTVSVIPEELFSLTNSRM